MERKEYKAKIECGEDVICERLIIAYHELTKEALKSYEEMGLPIPHELKFSDHEIVAMDSELNYPYDTWEVPFLPRNLTDKAFNRLVREGVFEHEIIPELDHGKETGNFINRYKKVIS